MIECALCKHSLKCIHSFAHNDVVVVPRHYIIIINEFFTLSKKEEIEIEEVRMRQ